MVSILLLERPRSRARFDLVQVPTELRGRLRESSSATESPATREYGGLRRFQAVILQSIIGPNAAPQGRNPYFPRSREVLIGRAAKSPPLGVGSEMF